MLDPFDAINRDLQTLREKSSAKGAFGASTYGFEMNPPVTEAEVARCEARFRFRLPDEYRNFLLRVGNGGAGPAYGVFRLGEMDEGFGYADWDNFIGDLSKPFLHSEEWNDFSETLGQLEAQEELLPEQEEEYEAALEEFEERYWAPHQIDGAIPICHLGCALRILLIVSGPQAGMLWHDDRADRGGLRPMKSQDGSRLTFLGWYRAWLDELLAMSHR